MSRSHQRPRSVLEAGRIPVLLLLAGCAVFVSERVQERDDPPSPASSKHLPAANSNRRGAAGAVADWDARAPGSIAAARSVQWRQAAAAAARLPPRKCVETLGQIMDEWVQSHPADAIAWAREWQAEPAVRQRILLRLRQPWMDFDSDDLGEFAAQLPEGYSQFKASVAGLLAGNDHRTAMDWALALKPGGDRNRILAVLAGHWAADAPREAAQFSFDLPPGDGRQRAVLATLAVWTRQDPEAPARWVARFAPGEFRRQALEKVLFAWAQEDAPTASNWLSLFPPGPDRDASISAFALASAPSHPETAFHWAASVTDERLRRRSMKQVLRLWLASDPGEAKLALSAIDLPASVKTTLLGASGR